LRRGLPPPFIDVSSGTWAFGTSLCGHTLDLPIINVIDRYTSEPLRGMLRALGCRIVVAPEKPGIGSQVSRLATAARIVRETGGTFLHQYDSPAVAAGYQKTVSRLALEVRPDVLVCSVGSGASSRGFLTLLRLLFPKLIGVGVDVCGSVTFGQKDEAQLRTIGGLGNSILPRNVVHRLYDDVHFISGDLARAACRQLARSEGRLRGDSSGAAFLTALWYAKRHPNTNVVFISPDTADRYPDTWSGDAGRDVLPSEPIRIQHPHQAEVPWSMIEWRRRSYEEVVGRLPERRLFNRLEQGRIS
jgi:cysteine synthase A